MKFFLTTTAFCTISLASAGCFAQATFVSSDIKCYELHIANIAFDSASGNSYRIPLRDYGLSKSDYAVLVKARIEGDLSEYHIPGRLPNDNSFGFRLKAGTKKSGDTLIITRRSGNGQIRFSTISILAYRRLNNWPLVRSNKAFRKFFVANYVPSYMHPDQQRFQPDLKSQRTARIIKLIH